MAFQLPKLPYDQGAMKGFLSGETFEFHLGKHHQAYITKLNDALPGSGFEEKSLEDIVKSADGGIFNNAAQAWNHTFYWLGLAPSTSNPGGDLAKAIEAEWGSVDKFKEAFLGAAATLFGSGWCWLCKDASGKLSIEKTTNADVPFKSGGLVPLMTCDVWEHAYYIDFRNARPKYLEAFWSHINWSFVEENYSASGLRDLTSTMKA